MIYYFINYCTKVTWLFLLKNKFEVSYVVRKFVALIKNQFGMVIKKFRSDKDYFNHTLDQFFQNEWIIRESSCVYTP